MKIATIQFMLKDIELEQKELEEENSIPTRENQEYRETIKTLHNTLNRMEEQIEELKKQIQKPIQSINVHI